MKGWRGASCSFVVDLSSLGLRVGVPAPALGPSGVAGTGVVFLGRTESIPSRLSPALCSALCSALDAPSVSRFRVRFKQLRINYSIMESREISPPLGGVRNLGFCSISSRCTTISTRLIYVSGLSRTIARFNDDRLNGLVDRRVGWRAANSSAIKPAVFTTSPVCDRARYGKRNRNVRRLCPRGICRDLSEVR